MRHEWARTAADVVWRRSKLGLVLDAREMAELEDFMHQRATAMDRTTAP